MPKGDKSAAVNVATFVARFNCDEDKAGDTLAGLQFQIERLNDACDGLSPDGIDAGDNPARTLAAIRAIQSCLAEFEVVLTRIALGQSGPFAKPSLKMVSLALRAIPIRLTVLGLEGEATPEDLADAVDAVSTIGDRPPEEKGLLRRAAQILRSDSEKHGVSEDAASPP